MSGMVGEITIEVESVDDLQQGLRNINLDSSDADAFRFKITQVDSIEGAMTSLDRLTEVIDRNQYDIDVIEITIEVRS